jgi:hypothetical protein
MSIFKTAYDTTACRGYMISKVQEGLTHAHIRELLRKDNTVQVYEVQGGHHIDELVPSFAHPILFKDKEGKEHLAIDVRGIGKYDSIQNSYVVRDVSAYEGMLIRAGLNDIWLEPTGPEQVRNLSTFPLAVYANWVGEAVAKRLALEPQDQFAVSVLAAILYLNLFWDEEKTRDLNKIDKTYLVGAITRGLNYKADTVYDIVEQHAGLANIEEFCNACKEFTQSVRMRDLNASTLFAMVGGYWYGVNGRELIAVALEHPPTWMSLLWQAMFVRSYHNAGLTKILERSTYKRLSGQFGIQLANLVKNT